MIRDAMKVVASTNQAKLDFVHREQGKHFCACGCGEAIFISHRHFVNGESRIPVFKAGHQKRHLRKKHGK